MGTPGTVMWGNAPGAAAAPVKGRFGAIALDSSYRIRAAVEGLTGAINLSADNITSPTDAVAVASFLLGYDAAGNNWDRVRQSAQSGTPGTTTAAAAALETRAQLLAGDISNNLRKLAASAQNELLVNLSGGASSGFAVDVNWAAILLQWIQAPIYIKTSAAVPTPFTTDRWNAPLGNTVGATYVARGAGALNGRDSATITPLTNQSTVVIKATPGRLDGAVITSLEAAGIARVIGFFNKTTAPVATDVPKFIFYVAGAGGQQKVNPEDLGPDGDWFSAGIAFAWGDPTSPWALILPAVPLNAGYFRHF